MILLRVHHNSDQALVKVLEGILFLFLAVQEVCRDHLILLVLLLCLFRPAGHAQGMGFSFAFQNYLIHIFNVYNERKFIRDLHGLNIHKIRQGFFHSIDRIGIRRLEIDGFLIRTVSKEQIQRIGFILQDKMPFGMVQTIFSRISGLIVHKILDC